MAHQRRASSDHRLATAIASTRGTDAPRSAHEGRCLLRAKLLVTDAWSEPIGDAGILIEGSRVESVGHFGAVARAYPRATVAQTRPDLLLPGLIDAHSHGRGYPLEAQNLSGVSLEQFILRLGAMTPIAPRDDAFASAAGLLSTGVTTTQVNFHTFGGPQAYLAGARETLTGLRQSGIRVTFVPCLIEQNAFVPEAALTEAPLALQDLHRQAAHGVSADEYFDIFKVLGPSSEAAISSVALGPCAAHWCSSETWDRVGRLLQCGFRAQTHLLETRSQRSDLYGTAAVPKLDRGRALSPQLSAVHGVWLKDTELKVLSGRGVTLVHCPGSNTRLGSGTAKVRDWLDAGIRVAFGLDSNTDTDPPDVFAELRHAATVADAIGAHLTPRELLAMATLGGAAACGQVGELGELKPGAKADMVAVTLPRPAPGQDAIECLLSTATRAAIADVWVDGKPLVRAGTYVHDAQAAAAHSSIARTLVQDAAARGERMRALAPLDRWARSHLTATRR
jgi:5-methylthioadenosine/S-adenosylhomocysteine deaminase